MSKGQSKLSYIQKTYQIFVRTLYIKENAHLILCSNNSGVEFNILPETVISLNQTFTATAIDILDENESMADKQLSLEIYFKKAQLSSIIFDISLQKIVKQSKTIFRKQLKNKNGYIDYKFVKCTTKIIRQDEFNSIKARKQVLKEKTSKSFQTLIMEIKQRNQDIKQKQFVLSSLQNKLHALQRENAQLVQRLNEQIAKIKQGMNIKIKIGKITAANHETICLKDQQKLELLKAIKQHESVNKNLEDEIKKLQIQLKIMQEMNEDNQNIKSKVSDDHMGQIDELKQKQQQFTCERTFNSHRYAQASDRMKEYKSFEYPSRFLNSELKIKSDKHQNISNLSMKSSIILRQKQPDMSIQQKASNAAKQLIHQKILPIEQKQQKKHINNDSKNFLRSSMYKSHEKSKINKSISIKIDDSDIDQLRFKFQHLRIQYQQQQQQVSILKQELNKKSKQIQNLLKKIAENGKEKREMQKQKAKLLQTFVSKLNLGDSEQNVKAVMKQINNFSKQITKQKDQSAKNFNKLLIDLEKQQANNKQLQIKQSKSTVKINNLNHQLIAAREKYCKQKENHTNAHKKLSQKQGQNLQLLQQLKVKKKLFQQLEQAYDLLKIKSKEQPIINEQNLALKTQIQKLVNKCLRYQSIEKNYKLLQQKYNELELEQDKIRIKLIKIEDDFNKAAKNDNLSLYQEEMDRILIIVFQEVTTFQKSFYQVLRVATKAILQSETKYYESFQTIDSFSRQSAISEKDSKMSEIRANIARYQERLNTKIQSMQVQIKNFEEGVKIVQQKIIDLEKFKDGIYDLLMKSQHLSSSQLLPPKQHNLKNSSISKSKISIQDIKILQQEQEQSDQQQKQQQLKKTGQIKLKNSKQKGWQRKSNQMIDMPKSVKSIQKMDIKQSNFMHVSSKFELSKLKHSISVKKSLLNDGVGIASSKLFGTLYDSTTDMKQSSKVIELKKEMSIERMKIRDRQFKHFQQTSQIIKKIDTSLLDQKMQKDRLISQHQKRQRDLQIQFEKVKREFKEKDTEINKIAKQLTAQSQEKTKIIEQNNIIKAQIIEALKQVQQTSEFLFTLQDERDELLAQRQKHRAIMVQYEQSERQMMLQLQTIKQYSKINQATLKQLIEERNRSFESLESIHKKQVKKMKETIQLLQSQITLQSQENITQKTNLQKSIIIKDEELQTLKNKISSLLFTQQNLSQQLQRAFAQKQQLQHEIEVYQKNIYELSDQVEAKQKEILRQQLKIRTQQKQYQICKTIQKQLKQRQQMSKTDIISALNNYKQQAKCWEDSFNSLQEKQKILTEDFKRKEQENISLKRQIFKINQLLKKRQDTILNLQRQLGQSQLKNTSIDLQLSKFKQSNQSLKYEIQELIKKEQIGSARHSNKVSRRTSVKKMKSDEYPNFTSLQADLGIGNNPSQLKFNEIIIQQFIGENEKECDQEDLIQEEIQSRLKVQCAYNAQLLKQKQEITAKNENLTYQIEQLQRLVNELRSKLGEYNKQMEKVSLKKKQFNEKIKEKQSNIQMLISELLSYQKQVQSQQKQNKMLKTKLQIATECKRSSQLTHHQLVEMRNQIQKNRSIICHLSTKLSQNELLLEKYKKTNQINNLNRIEWHQFKRVD